MNIGIKEIAQACGLSANSVSDILNRDRGHLYRPETREKVLRVAAELNYRPNRAARAMRSRQSRAVGFLAYNMGTTPGTPGPMLENYTVYPFVVGMSHYFTDRGFHVSLVEMKEVEGHEPGQLPEVLREQYFDGLVLHYGVPEAICQQLVQNKIPVIWWDSGNFEAADCIYRDEAAVTRQLLGQLFALGHERIAFAVGQTGWERYQRGELLHYSYHQRYDAYLEAMKEKGLEPLRVVSYDPQRVASQLKDQKVTALLTNSGSYLQTLVNPCLNLGWSIPRELSVVGNDIEVRVRQLPPMMSGMTYDRYDAGQQAAAMLHTKIENPGAEVPSRRLTGEFRVGDTLAPPRCRA